eukprot:SAG11_NODE_92_length_17132_cov_10.277285_14_plen_179_part_00
MRSGEYGGLGLGVLNIDRIAVSGYSVGAQMVRALRDSPQSAYFLSDSPLSAGLMVDPSPRYWRAQKETRRHRYGWRDVWWRDVCLLCVCTKRLALAALCVRSYMRGYVSLSVDMYFAETSCGVIADRVPPGSYNDSGPAALNQCAHCNASSECWTVSFVYSFRNKNPGHKNQMSAGWS